MKKIKVCEGEVLANGIIIGILKRNFLFEDLHEHGLEILEQLMYEMQEDLVTIVCD